MDSFFGSPRSSTTVNQLPYLRQFQHRLVSSNQLYLHLAGISRTGSSEEGAWIDFDRVKDLEKAACLQAWLFFGLLSQFFGKYVRPDDFVKGHNQEHQFVSVAETDLLNISSWWRSNLNQTPTDARKRTLQDKIMFLKEVLQICDRMDIARIEDLQTDNQKLLAEVMLSIRLLISALYSFAELALYETSEDPLTDFAINARSGPVYVGLRNRLLRARIASSEKRLTFPLQPGASTTYSYLALSKRFLDNGWCPIRCQQLCQTYDYAILVYMAKLDQRGQLLGQSHGNCGQSSRCSAYDMNRSNYSQRHCEETCSNTDCTPIEVARTDLARIIDNETLPLLSLDPKAHNFDPITVFASLGTPFTAISHVWSDGLGNPSFNSIPSCQLKRIVHLLQSIEEKEKKDPYLHSKRIYLWMDTLCIPVKASADHIGSDPTAPDQTRRKALQYIAAIFEAADQTLILDSSLDKITSEQHLNQASLEEELCCQVMGGKWIQRAWTLQEGGLAKKCYFNIGTYEVLTLGVLDPDDFKKGSTSQVANKRPIFRSKSSSSTNESIQLNVYDEFYIPLKFLLAKLMNEPRKKLIKVKASREDERDYQNMQNERFVNSWNQLLERSASEPADLVLIFASLLDLNTTDFANMPEEQRLPKVLRSLSEIPLSILFNTKKGGLCSTSPCDGWIPTELGGDRLADNGSMNWCHSPQGLQLKFDLSKTNSDQLLVLNFDQLIPWDTHLFRVENESESCGYIIDVRAPQSIACQSQAFRQVSKARYNENQSSYIIIDKQLGTDLLNGYSGRGARFSCCIETDGLCLQYDQPLTAWTFDQWMYNTGSNELPSSVYRYSASIQRSALRLEQSKF
jgi:hypothetical protein